MLAGSQQEGQVARVGIADQGAGTFIQHVGIDAVSAQKCNPTLPMRSFGPEPGKLAFHGGKLLLEVLLSPQPMVAGEGIGGEIADEQRGKNIETEDGQNGAAAAMRDPDAPRSPKPVKAPLNFQTI